MKKINPFLWFDNNAEEAINFYISIFKNSKIISITRYPENIVPKMNSKILTAIFELDGQQFMAFDGGPQFKFNESVSMYVDCKDQDEVDDLWEKLGEGGEYGKCGWLKDRYGLSWQIVPSELGEMMQDKDLEKSKKVMNAMLKMDKIDIDMLKKASS